MAPGDLYCGQLAFEESCKNFQQYPTNLVYRASYRKVLEAYQNRLEKASPRLFRGEENPCAPVDVQFRDFNSETSEFDETMPNQVRSLDTLKVYLGDTSTAASGSFGRPDPRCRFISITSEMNRLPLKISHAMANLLLTYHQVMPSYLDFVSVFGAQLEQREVRYSGFHVQSTLGTQSNEHPPVPSLGRSGRGYQLCYNLKAVVDKGGEGKEKEWSKRQAAVHHQFDIKNGNALWICTEGRALGGFFERVRDLTQDDKRRKDWSYGNRLECFLSSLATHLSCCYWSIEEWRSYLSWLEETVEKETESAVGGIREPMAGITRKTYTSNDLMLMQGYVDKANEVVAILEANADVMKSLSNFYSKLPDNHGFGDDLAAACKDPISEFSAQIGDMIYDAKMQIRRARLLVKITSDRKALLLQHLQSQATEAMTNLTQASHTEASTMRIVTVFTLIYLPATFVSIFFSTQVVGHQGIDDNGSFSQITLWRWSKVAIPLSGLMLSIAYAWYRYEETKSRKAMRTLCRTTSPRGRRAS